MIGKKAYTNLPPQGGSPPPGKKGSATIWLSMSPNAKAPLTPIIQADGWQKCPVCDGSGIDHKSLMSTSQAFPICNTCYGQKIISIRTGKPPGKNAG